MNWKSRKCRRQSARRVPRSLNRAPRRVAQLALVALVLALVTPSLAVAGPLEEAETTVTAPGLGWGLASLTLPAWLEGWLGSLGIGHVSDAAGGGITVGGVAQDSGPLDLDRMELRTVPPTPDGTTEGSTDPKP